MSRRPFVPARIGRRSQIFEIWIRPVVPENTQMAMRIALYETQKMIDNGLSQEDFENTRDYLLKNVYLLTSNQNQRLGYALDSWWFGIGDYVDTMRAAYMKLTRDDVNKAIKKYLSAKDLHVVIITKMRGLAGNPPTEDKSRRANTTPPNPSSPTTKHRQYKLASNRGIKIGTWTFREISPTATRKGRRKPPFCSRGKLSTWHQHLGRS